MADVLLHHVDRVVVADGGHDKLGEEKVVHLLYKDGDSAEEGGVPRAADVGRGDLCEKDTQDDRRHVHGVGKHAELIVPLRDRGTAGELLPHKEPRRIDDARRHADDEEQTHVREKTDIPEHYLLPHKQECSSSCWSEATRRAASLPSSNNYTTK